MKLQRPWTGSSSQRTVKAVAGPRPASDPVAGTIELAHAFVRAQQETGGIERSGVSSTDGWAELSGAVRVFVVAQRADGSPPERILAVIKSVTRRCFDDDVDEVHGDRLQTLILREFLTSYYDVAPALAVSE